MRRAPPRPTPPRGARSDAPSQKAFRVEDKERTRLIAAVNEANEMLAAARNVSERAWMDAYAKFDVAAAALNEYERRLIRAH